jgi:hypothetical protein
MVFMIGIIAMNGVRNMVGRDDWSRVKGQRRGLVWHQWALCQKIKLICGTPFQSVAFLGFCCVVEKIVKFVFMEIVVDGTSGFSAEGCCTLGVFTWIFWER